MQSTSSDLQEVQGILGELQMLQLAAPRLQLSDLLLQLLQQLLGPPLHRRLLLLQLSDQPGLVPLDGRHQRDADLRAALNLSLRHFLWIETIQLVKRRRNTAP